MSDERLLTVGEAARRLGVSTSTLRRWADEGKVPAVRLPWSNYRRFRPEDIERVRRLMGHKNGPEGR